MFRETVTTPDRLVEQVQQDYRRATVSPKLGRLRVVRLVRVDARSARVTLALFASTVKVEGSWRVVPDGEVYRYEKDYRVVLANGDVDFARLERALNKLGYVDLRVPVRHRESRLLFSAECLPILFPYVPPRALEDVPQYGIVQADPLTQVLQYREGDQVKEPPTMLYTMHFTSEAVRKFLTDPATRANLAKWTDGLVNDTNFGRTEEVKARALAYLRHHEGPPHHALYALGAAVVWERWGDRLDELKGPRRLTELPPLPEEYRPNVALLPHQQDAVLNLLRDDAAYLSVDMGGGKTVIALVDCLYQLASGKVRLPLIVTTVSLQAQTVEELRRFSDGKLTILALETATARRLVGDAKAAEAFKRRVVPGRTLLVTTYEAINTVDGYPAFLMGYLNVDMVTLDEAHTIKNPRGSTARRCFALAHAKVRRVMSGTFAANTLEDVLIPLGFSKPHALNVPWSKIRTAKYDLSLDDVAHLRQNLLKEGALVYDRAAWVDQLPPRRLKVHRVTPSEESRKRLDEELTKAKTALERQGEQAFVALRHKLDQVLAAEKAAVVAKILEENPDDRALIFCKWKETVRTIYRQLPEHLRAQVAPHWAGLKGLQAFLEGRARHLLAVDATLKQGLNLQAANRIIRVELSYTWSEEDQSYARAWRYGQAKPVNIDLVVCDRSHDVLLLRNLMTKYALSVLMTKPWEPEALEKYENQYATLAALDYASLKAALRQDAERVARDFAALAQAVWAEEDRQNKVYYANLPEKKVRIPKGQPPKLKSNLLATAVPSSVREALEALYAPSLPKYKVRRVRPKVRLKVKKSTQPIYIPAVVPSFAGWHVGVVVVPDRDLITAKHHRHLKAYYFFVDGRAQLKRLLDRLSMQGLWLRHLAVLKRVFGYPIKPSGLPEGTRPLTVVYGQHPSTGRALHLFWFPELDEGTDEVEDALVRLHWRRLKADLIVPLSSNVVKELQAKEPAVLPVLEQLLKRARLRRSV